MSTPLPRVSKRPYRLEGSRASALYLHGYTGTPYDLKPLAQFLSKNDIGGYAPLLTGHGTKAKKLENVSLQNWLTDSEEAYLTLSDLAPRYVVGLSMGALLGALIATNPNYRVDALVLLSPALHLKSLGLAVGTLSEMGLYHFLPSIPKEGGQSDIADPEGRKLCPSYSEMPLKGLNEFMALQKKVLPEIPKISCPIFIGVGSHDHTINIQASVSPFMASKAPYMELKEYKNSQHILPLDLERDDLNRDVLTFLLAQSHL